MPSLKELNKGKGGFFFFFWSNEGNEPVHIHISKDSKAAKI
jgi:Domain of unknown function (DUF4160)